MLKGAKRIIFDELKALLLADKQPTIFTLACFTGYSERTVQRVLRELQGRGLIVVTCRRGCPSTYRIMEQK